MIPHRTVSSLPLGTALTRVVMSLAASKGNLPDAIELSRLFRDSPTVTATLDALLRKDAVEAGTTIGGSDSAALTQYGIAAEAIALMRGTSIFGALEPRGMRKAPFHTKVPRETGGGTGGGWVGEGLTTALGATAYDSLMLEMFKIGRIVALSTELLKLGDPAAEATVRQTMIAALTAYLDAQFLTSTVTAIANVRPAAVTNGATAVTTTGTTTAQMSTDLAALLAAITTPGGGLTWIMRPMTAYRIAATLGGQAAVDVPRALFGVPMILSVNAPAQITLVDAAAILYGDDGGMELSVSEEATIQMDSAPSDPAVDATVQRSLWQLSLFGVRMIRYISFLRAQTGSVAYMAVAY